MDGAMRGAGGWGLSVDTLQPQFFFGLDGLYELFCALLVDGGGELVLNLGSASDFILLFAVPLPRTQRVGRYKIRLHTRKINLLLHQRAHTRGKILIALGFGNVGEAVSAIQLRNVGSGLQQGTNMRGLVCLYGWNPSAVRQRWMVRGETRLWMVRVSWIASCLADDLGCWRMIRSSGRFWVELSEVGLRQARIECCILEPAPHILDGIELGGAGWEVERANSIGGEPSASVVGHMDRCAIVNEDAATEHVAMCIDSSRQQSSIEGRIGSFPIYRMNALP